jgi:predicted metal-dependent HD superfamily phosphohydrolase
MHWQRTFLQPMLANFDAPSREECTATRSVANTPQQALTLLNDPTFVEAARVLAQEILATPAGSDDERIDALFQRALARPTHPAERKSLGAFLAAMRRTYQDSPEDARKLLRVGFAPLAANADETELAAWTSVCRVVLNLHETITRY